MLENLRFELSFKNVFQLEKQLKFCESNNIKKINIPCKGLIKKEFLNESIKYIGENYKELDVIYHYSLFHQFTKNRDNSYLEFLKFLNKCTFYRNKEILLVSGSNKKKNFDVISILEALKHEEKLRMKIGVAYNPYLKTYYDIFDERDRFLRKISTGLTKSIWLQFGTDIKLLESELNFIKTNLYKKRKKDQNIRIFGSLLIPSKQFIARFKFRPWKGVHISGNYLNSIEEFFDFIKDLNNFYLKNNICPVIETDFCSSRKLEDIYSLIKK